MIHSEEDVGLASHLMHPIEVVFEPRDICSYRAIETRSFRVGGVYSSGWNGLSEEGALAKVQGAGPPLLDSFATPRAALMDRQSFLQFLSLPFRQSFEIGVGYTAQDLLLLAFQTTSRQLFL